MLAKSELKKIAGIEKVDEQTIVKFNQIVNENVQKELGKLYSNENAQEYRFLSRLYNQFASIIDTEFSNKESK